MVLVSVTSVACDDGGLAGGCCCAALNPASLLIFPRMFSYYVAPRSARIHHQLRRDVSRDWERIRAKVATIATLGEIELDVREISRGRAIEWV